MRKVFYLTVFIFKALSFDKSSRFAALFALMAGAAALLFSNVDIAVKHKLLKDALYAFESFFMILSGALYPFLATQKEKSGVFAYAMSLCASSRGGYPIALHAAIFAVLFFIFLVFAFFDVAVFAVLSSKFEGEFFSSLALSFLSSALLSFLVLTLSRLVSPATAAVLGIFVFLGTSGADTLLLFLASKGDGFWLWLSYLVYYALPNFSFFNAAYGQNYESFAFSSLYFCLYSSLLFSISFVLFKKEALKIG